VSYRPYRVSQRDANEPKIVATLDKFGARWWRMEPPCPFDLLVLYRGVFYAVEVKSGKGRLTDNQRRFDGEAPLWIVRTPEDVADAIAEWGNSAIYSRGCK